MDMDMNMDMDMDRITTPTPTHPRGARRNAHRRWYAAERTRAIVVRGVTRLLTTATQLQRSAHQVRSKCALVPGTNVQLGIRRLRTQLKVGILHRVTDGVDSSQESGRKKVLALKVAAS